ncbi:MAG: aconitase family protein [Hyphomonadaceae bacterium]
MRATRASRPISAARWPIWGSRRGRRASIAIDRAFIILPMRASKTCEAASVLAGRRVAPGVRAMVAPGSSAVRRQAEAEGLDRVFLAAGFEW